MQPYLLFPEDRSFFRDARPMSSTTGSDGHGARWPEPSQLFAALHGALHGAFPTRQDWEQFHPTGHGGLYPNPKDEPQRFGSLTTTGPFPCQWDTKAKSWLWLFPRPADVVMAEGIKALHPIEKLCGCSDSPAPLRYLLGNPCPPSKREPPRWWTRDAWQAYLGDPSATAVTAECFRCAENLYTSESTTGIGMDPATQTQDGERIYSAQYLRLRDDVAYGFAAAMPVDGADGLPKLWQVSNSLRFGGQQSVARVFCPEAAPRPDVAAPTIGSILPTSPSSSWRSGYVKWTLVTPAVFPFIASGTKNGNTIGEHPGGWLPNWVAPSDGFAGLDVNDQPVKAGQVLLKPRLEPPGGARTAWREAVRRQPFIRAHLVAARVPKPVYVTGWSDRRHLRPDDSAVTHLNLRTGRSPRSGYYAVPAGAAYYFEVEDGRMTVERSGQHTELSHTELLVDLLSWHGLDRPGTSVSVRRRSTLFGEHGFGLGVCSTWRFYEQAAAG